ncbi:MAG: penicillin-binding protein 2 [Chloroflexi bacterium]|nr:penicillin-binding protein 2 [Chloroflexota bacterium]
MHNDQGGKKLIAWRIDMTYAVMIILLGGFAIRLYDLQITQGEDFAARADENRFSALSVPAPRGVISDRNNFLLVQNIPIFNVVITPALLPDSLAEIEEIYRVLSSLTGVPIDQEGEPATRCTPGRGILQYVLEGDSIGPFDAWPIACDIDETTARIIREAMIDMPGVGLEILPVRDYTTGKLSASFIGYMGPISELNREFYEDLGFQAGRDKVGYAGLEGVFQDILAGRNGQKLIEEDVAGQLLREVGTVLQPTPGNNLRLTIDTRLQAAAETALAKRMEFINRSKGENASPIGVVIAMNPQTGEILAMVSLPTYENNRLARFIPQLYYQQLAADERGKPLINHAISDRYPPGSIFKLVTAIGALNEGVITPTRELFDPGKITIENKYFPNDPGKAKDFVCWKRDGHGDVDFVHGIAFSCNVYFYKIGGGFKGEIDSGGLGIDRIGWYAHALGYGNQLGIDLPGEEDGLIPTQDWKRRTQGESWSTGDTYNATTGQGYVLATPLQVLTSLSTLANGGKVMWPHLVKEILDGEGNVIEAIERCVLWDISDNILTPASEIGSNCNSMPESLRPQYDVTPDLIVEPWVIEQTQIGMQLVVAEGTASEYAQLEAISSAGKTGTGEFCDEVSQEKNLCEPGNWPTHSWYAAYAPYENPEIVVVAFVYNGGEGAVTSGPIVRQVLEAYFAFKSIDAANRP